MHPLSSITEARNHLNRKADSALAHIRTCSETAPEDLKQKIGTLRLLRSRVYEDLNQIQHRALLLDAADYLDQKLGGSIAWSWHPEQTGHANEPDLLGTQNGEVIVSAEATTSPSPKGSLDTHMKSTLLSLSQMDGKLYYFVRTAKMANRAKTKVSKMEEADITVVIL
jgi:hypothetical protein